MSLTLNRSIELALENNEILRMAREDLYKAGQQVNEARADALPQINASGTYTRNWKLPTFVFGSPPNTQEVSIGGETRFLDGIVEGVFGKTLFSERLMLDGLVSLWHPDLL